MKARLPSANGGLFSFENMSQTVGKTLFSPTKGEKSSLAISGKATPILNEGKASVSKRRPVLLRKHVLIIVKGL